MRFILWSALMGLVVVTQVGCASLRNLFRSYPAQMAGVKEGLMYGEVGEAKMKELGRGVGGVDKVLYLAERGRVHSLVGDLEGSMRDYREGLRQMEANEMKAEVRVSEIGANGLALFLNDNVIPYEGHFYEKIMMHAYQALNYMEKRDLEGALVEVRKADNERRFAESFRKKEDGKVKELSEQYEVEEGENGEVLRRPREDLMYAAGNIKRSYDNGLMEYLSGLLFEVNKEENEAYVFYKKALNIFPENRYIGERVVYLAKRLGREDDLERYKGIYGKGGVTGRKGGRLVIIYEEGFVPEKEGITVPFIWGGRTYTVSLPMYPGRMPFGRRVEVDVGKGGGYLSEPLCYVGALAARALEEEYPKIYLRQVMRLVTKHLIQKEAQESGNDGIYLFTAIGGVLMERADLRSWLTLPNSVQLVDVEMGEGEYEVNLRNEAGVIGKKRVKIGKGEVRVVRCVDLGGGGMDVWEVN